MPYERWASGGGARSNIVWLQVEPGLEAKIGVFVGGSDEENATRAELTVLAVNLMLDAAEQIGIDPLELVRKLGNGKMHATVHEGDLEAGA